jgi:glycosyltransferase involved in cell wall biosynthesis
VKILVVHNSYKTPGGEDTVVTQETELLRAHGHEVNLYLRSNHELDNLSIGQKLMLPLGVLWARDRHHSLRGLLNEWRPDIVHVHNTFVRISPSVYSLFARARLPVVQTLHNYRAFCPRADFFRDGVCEDCMHKWFAWPGILHACYRNSRLQTAGMAMAIATQKHKGRWNRHVDAFIALTEFARGKFLQGGFPYEKLIVKPNFVAPDPGPGTHDGEEFLYVGRFDPAKRIETLLYAWQLNDGLPLKIVGTGASQRSTDDLIRRFASVKGVEWFGWQRRPEVVRLMKKAFCLVFPSEWYEGFPMVIVEAFACGLPVIVSRLGSMAEVVTDGITGLHFTPGDVEDLAAKVHWARVHP